jgi:hypothetical protein
MHIKVCIISSLLLMFSVPANALVFLDFDPYNANDKIFQRKSAFQALEKKYHNEAKKFPEVCAVLIKAPGDDMMDIGTGTYFAKNENTGYVITAASIAIKAINKLPFLFLAFVPEYQENPDRIKAKNFYHPDFDQATTINDVAIIEFDITKLRSKIKPRPIDFVKDYKPSKCLEGIILGYGHFGTTITELLDLGKVHYAETYMYLDYDNEEGHPFFKVNLPHLSNFYPDNEIISKESYRFADEFASIDSYEGSPVIIMQDSCSFRVHSKQGFYSGGDGGGPLFMKNKNGAYRFVGVANFMGIRKYGGEKHSAIKVAFMQWEPLFIHKEWIEKIINHTSIIDDL